jgi:hypothetical protein
MKIQIRDKDNAPPARLLGAVAICETSLRNFMYAANATPQVIAALEVALPQAELSRWVRMATTHGLWVSGSIGRASLHKNSLVRSAPMGLGWAHTLILHPLATGSAQREKPFLFVRRKRDDNELLPGERRRLFAALDAAVAVPLREDWTPRLWAHAADRRHLAEPCLEAGGLEGWLVTGNSHTWANVVRRLLEHRELPVEEQVA